MISNTSLCIAGGATAAAILGTLIYWRKKNEIIPWTWIEVGTLKEIDLHPLKSGRRIELTKVDVTEVGLRQASEDQKRLALRDRFLIVYTETENEFRTARNYPKMVLIEVSAHDADHVSLDAPTMRTLYVKIPPRKPHKDVHVTVHRGEQINGIDCGDEAAVWLSRYLLEKDFGLRLAYNDCSEQRDMTKTEYKLMECFKNFTSRSGGVYHDLTSIMLMNKASVQDLNKRMNNYQITVKNFRPNFLVEGPPPYDEDNWEWVKIGNVIFRSVAKCYRCFMTTVDPETGISSSDREPLKSLEQKNTFCRNWSAQRTNMKIYLFAVLAFNACYNHAVLADCEIDPHVKNAPLVIKHRSTSFIYPHNGSETVSFAESEVVDLSCPGRNVVIGGKHINQSVVEATCISKTAFKINGNEYHWPEIKCSAILYAHVRKTKRQCGYGFMETEVGFQVDENRFITTYSVCFDNVNQNTMYSFFNLTSEIASAARGVPRPNFYEDKGFYHVGGVPVYKLYARTGQRKTINTLLGLHYSSTKYIQNGAWLFLARGHLTAKADFVYAAQQDSTFRFLNVAPQWQSFNGKNWERVESSTRAYAVKHETYLLIWTGTHGVATLPHESTGEEVKLYLYVDGEKRGIPVPALYWKLIYSPISKQGVVLIGHNNPYEKSIGKHVICPDVSDKIEWVSWNRTNIRDGYSYACEVESFRKVVKYAPKVYVTGLLV